MKITIGLRDSLLIVMGVGLGYYKAMQDAEGVIERLDRMQATLDEVARTVKYGDFIEGRVIEEATAQGDSPSQ